MRNGAQRRPQAPELLPTEIGAEASGPITTLAEALRRRGATSPTTAEGELVHADPLYVIGDH